MTKLIKQNIAAFITVFFMLGAPAAYAEVAPFGQVIGTATYANVKSALSAKTTITATGTNKWSGGPMLASNGRGLGIDGLKEATFIFNARKILVGVILDLPKYRYADMKNALQSKYRLTTAQEPFVGNRLAKFRDGDITITADAPHMSFDMQVLYIHKSLQNAHSQGKSAEDAAQKKREGSQL